MATPRPACVSFLSPHIGLPSSRLLWHSRHSYAHLQASSLTGRRDTENVIVMVPKVAGRGNLIHFTSGKNGQTEDLFGNPLADEEITNSTVFYLTLERP